MKLAILDRLSRSLCVHHTSAAYVAPVGDFILEDSRNPAAFGRPSPRCVPAATSTCPAELLFCAGITPVKQSGHTMKRMWRLSTTARVTSTTNTHNHDPCGEEHVRK